MLKLKKGEIVPVSLQLGDGSTKEQCKAFVYSSDKKLLAEYNLKHFRGGYYYFDELVMPDDNITIQYRVISSDIYEIVSDIFLVEKEELKLLGKIVSHETIFKGFLGRVLDETEVESSK